MQDFPTIETEIGKPWYEGVKDPDYLKVRNDELNEKINKGEPLNFVDLMIYAYKASKNKDKKGEGFLKDAFELTKAVPRFVSRTDLVIDAESYDDPVPEKSWREIKLADLGFNLNIIANAKEYLEESNLPSLDKTLEIINNLTSENNN